MPQLNDTSFVSQLVFRDSRRAPKERFAYLFPSRATALIQVRLKPGPVRRRARREAIALVREAVAMPRVAAEGGGRYVTTGAPVVLSDLGDELSHSLVVLLVAALVIMAADARGRVPRAAAAAAAAWSGCAAGRDLRGARADRAALTMASIGVLPVLIGLAVDYAIQFQSRTREEGPPRARGAVGAPAILTAGLATAAGFLVLGSLAGADGARVRAAARGRAS